MGSEVKSRYEKRSEAKGSVNKRREIKGSEVNLIEVE